MACYVSPRLLTNRNVFDNPLATAAGRRGPDREIIGISGRQGAMQLLKKAFSGVSVSAAAQAPALEALKATAVALEIPKMAEARKARKEGAAVLEIPKTVEAPQARKAPGR